MPGLKLWLNGSMNGIHKFLNNDLSVRQIAAYHFCDDLVCGTILYYSSFYLLQRSRGKKRARTIDIKKAIRPDVQEAVVYHYLALCSVSHDIRNLAPGTPAFLARSQLDVDQIVFCVASFCLSWILSVYV